MRIVPFVSHKIAFSFGKPIAFKSSKQAIPAAPAPFTTILLSLKFFPVRSKAFNRAAVDIIAVPCWSS